MTATSGFSVRRLGPAAVAVLLAVTLGVTAAVPTATASPTSPRPTSAETTSADTQGSGATPPSVIAPRDRATLLGRSWRTSADRAWTTTGDSIGLHLLVAEEKSGYAWHNAATLVEPGFEADQWIGNACVTASGRRAVVVYAPRTFTNKADLFARGGFTAIVDLTSGAVRKLPIQSSLAYFNPGCGTGESVVLTQGGGEDKASTRLIRVDARTGDLGKPLELAGDVTSAVPLADGAVAAADSARVVRIDRRGARTTLAGSTSVPFDLRVDRSGGVAYLDHSGNEATAHRVDPARASQRRAPVLARGGLTDVGLTSTATGSVYVTGRTRSAGTLPATIQRLDVDKDAQMSTRGRSAIVRTRWADGKDSRVQPSGDGARPVDIELTTMESKRSVPFRLNPTFGTGKHRAEGGRVSPALGKHGAVGTKAGTASAKAGTAAKGQSARAAAAGSPSDPVESERYCSVPRNDPRNQAMQPKPRQVEWAVDQAITGNLNSLISRPANWKNLGMPAYQPQTLFPRPEPAGGGRVPAQIMLGITAQESNLWQTPGFIIPGVTGNPLIGNFYGRDIYNSVSSDDWDINWADADCGYGVTQVTDGMRLAGHERDGEKAFAYQTQRAIALDYTANVAAGLQILVDKWNQTRNAGLTVNNGDISKIENWFFAVWAYNSGLHPQSEAGKNAGAWGLGWLNNPANPNYPANRASFMEKTAADAAHPERWPYEEKVLGFAAHPPALLESPGTEVAAYRAAWWNGDATTGPLNRAAVKPPVNQFCDSSNQCEPGKSYKPNDPDVSGEPAGPCAHRNAAGQYDLKCWYNKASTWKSDCNFSCGNELLRFNSTYAEQADGTAYPPNCSLSGLPSNALVVDEVADGIGSVRPDCGRPWTNAGSFSFNFPTDTSGLYPAKVDLHQIGGGFGGHFYLGHSRTAFADGGKLKISGTWSLNSSQSGKWARVLVHVPNHHAHTQQARYEIDTGDGKFDHFRYLNQKRRANAWVSLGVYKMTGKPQVRLTTEAEDGTGDDDVAFDSVAFQPLSAKPKHIVAVMGDSYTSGEGAGDYYQESDIDHGAESWNACRRSRNAWARQMTLPGTSAPLGTKIDAFETDVELGFVACSGAQTKNVQAGLWADNQQDFREGQFHEVHQMNSGVLDENTTLVMLTLGGNDENGFAKAMKACSLINNCSLDENFLPSNKKKIDKMITKLFDVLTEIADEAPKAKIVLMGYPELLSRTVKCGGSLWFDGSEAAALAELVNYADDKQKGLIDSLRTGFDKNVDYANPVSDFVGHSGCDDPEWIHKLVSGPNGDGDYRQSDPVAAFTEACGPAWIPDWLPDVCLSREAFHPNKTGAGDPGYAGVMRKRLTAIGYKGS